MLFFTPQSRTAMRGYPPWPYSAILGEETSATEGESERPHPASLAIASPISMVPRIVPRSRRRTVSSRVSMPSMPGTSSSSSQEERLFALA